MEVTAHTCVELEELFLLSTCETGGNQPSCQHFQVLQENCLSTEQNQGQNLLRHCDHKFASDELQESTSPRLPKIPQDASVIQSGSEPRRFAKIDVILSRRRPLILDNNKEFAAITGQGKRIADHEQELKIKAKHQKLKK